MARLKRQRGFSLLELMVVTTLLVVLGVLAAPSMRDWMKNQRISNSAQSVLHGLQQAREEAVRRNRSVSFWLVSDLSSACTLSSASASWVVSLSSPVGKCDEEPSLSDAPQLVVSHASEAVLSVKAIDAGAVAANRVQFNEYGRIEAGTTPIDRIDFVDSQDAGESDPANHVYRSLRVVIQGTGAVRLCDPRVLTAGDTRAC